MVDAVAVPALMRARWRNGLIIALLQSALAAAAIALGATLALPASKTDGEDFIQDYLSAREWLRGGDPYGNLVALRRAQGFSPTRPDPVRSNPHPPLAIMAAVPVCTSRYPLALLGWKVINLAAFGIAWTWAWRTFGRATWLSSAAAVAAGLWAPVWQGTDFGQPSGFLCFLTAALWQAARTADKHRGGVLLGMACAVRPFFFILSASFAGGKPRSIALAAVGAIVGGLLPFAVLDKSPVEWWRDNASESARYAAICGTLGNALGLGSAGGTALYLASWCGMLALNRRGCDRDAVFALSVALLLLTYPIAWYHYDALALPVLVWLGLRAVAGNRRWPLWCGLVYIACRTLPSTQETYETMMRFQFAGRGVLVVGTAAMMARPKQLPVEASAKAAAGN